MTYFPALAWRTLSAFNAPHMLLFDGQPGPNSQTVLITLDDSAILLSVLKHLDPTFIIETQSWADEPIRRMRHATASVQVCQVDRLSGQKIT